ncbi:MAG: helix-turn-helix transcriptional regulator [Clostridia bacterium]|nr:helix-turn-helix transcriptional regulator [Clostridia bacterium]
MSIGNKIYELRTAKNLSQGDLAEILDVSRQSVSKWETDTAVPELDKLIKLCDVFGVTLDELAERTPPRDSAPTITVIEKTSSFTPQKAVGCIILAAALIGGRLLLLLSGISEIAFILFPAVMALLACGIICLCLKSNVGYWCVWSAFAPVTVLTPHIVGLPILSGIGIAQIIFFAIMEVYAVKKLKYPSFKVDTSKTYPLILAWIICAALYAVTLFVLPLGFISMVLINNVVYAAFALLITYTGIFVQNKKSRIE